MIDWSRKKVADLIDGLTAGVSVRSIDGRGYGPAVLKTSAVDQGRFVPNEVKTILPADRHRARCNPMAGSLIMSRMNTPAMVGDVGYVRNDYPDLFLPDRLWLARSKHGSRTDMRWLTYLFASEPGAALLHGLASGTSMSMQSIPKDRVLELEIHTPPPAEQHAIGDALESADDLIATLERLIAKKQAIKQGMMQQLLTGKTRLPGFTGEWKTASIADQSVMKARIGWQGLKTDEYKSSGEYSLVGGTDFVDGRVDWSATPFVDKWRFEQDRYIQLRVGDVLLTKDGSIGKTAYVDSLPRPATLNSGVFVIRPVGDAYDSRFFYLTLRSRVFEEFLARLSAGSTISHLYQRDLVTLELELPPTLAEQRAIADAIFEAESEVALLRQRLMKVRSIKQGMMQQLLTGRTRLPVDDVE